MKKRIVFIVEAMLGGIRQHVCDIAKHLDKRQYEVYFIYSEGRADKTFFEEAVILEKEGVHLYRCNEMKREIGIFDFKAYKKIVHILKEVRPDIVHCHSSKAGIVGRIAAKRCGVKKIFYTPNAYVFQNPELSGGKKFFYILAEKILGSFFTSATINVSKGEKELAERYHIAPKSTLKLIYNGIADKKIPDKNELRKRLGYGTEDYLIGVTARCAPQKDPMTFLQIAKVICSKYENVKFLYIGNGSMYEQMQLWVRQENLSNRVNLLGFRDDSEEIVGALDIYLSTALYEGLPYSMLEAMRAGVPIIATDTVGNNELVSEGRTGMLFPIGSIAEGCRLIEKQMREVFISRLKVKESFMKKFSLNAMINQLVVLYDSGGGKIIIIFTAVKEVAA